jgi:hypothetical protein
MAEIVAGPAVFEDGGSATALALDHAAVVVTFEG